MLVLLPVVKVVKAFVNHARDLNSLTTCFVYVLCYHFHSCLSIW